MAHPRKLRDEAEAPGKMEVAGAGGIVNGADNVFSIWRAQKDEAPANPNDPEAVAAWEAMQSDIDAKLILKKQREDGVQDYTQVLWFDKPSMQYRTSQRRYPLRFVEFSIQDQEVPLLRLVRLVGSVQFAQLLNRTHRGCDHRDALAGRLFCFTIRTCTELRDCYESRTTSHLGLQSGGLGEPILHIRKHLSTNTVGLLGPSIVRKLFGR